MNSSVVVTIASLTSVFMDSSSDVSNDTVFELHQYEKVLYEGPPPGTRRAGVSRVWLA